LRHPQVPPPVLHASLPQEHSPLQLGPHFSHGRLSPSTFSPSSVLFELMACLSGPFLGLGSKVDLPGETTGLFLSVPKSPLLLACGPRIALFPSVVMPFLASVSFRLACQFWRGGDLLWGLFFSRLFLADYIQSWVPLPAPSGFAPLVIFF